MLFAMYCSCGQAREFGMRVAYGASGGEKKCLQEIGGETWRKGTLLEDRSVGGGIT